MMKTKQMTCYGDLGLHVTQGTLFCLEEYAEHFFTLHPFLSTQKLYFNGFDTIQTAEVHDIVY